MKWILPKFGLVTHRSLFFVPIVYKEQRALPSRASSSLVQQDGDTVDGTAAPEVSLEFLGSRTVVDVANKDASVVDVFFVLAHFLLHLLEIFLHLSKLRRFRF
jgi:hypothetical protein